MSKPDEKTAVEAPEIASNARPESEQAPDGSEHHLPQDSEQDPDLLALSRKRRGRHPIISVIVILLSAYLMFFTRKDIAYFLESSRPTDAGVVQDAISEDLLHDNTYVRLAGAPDRKHVLTLKGKITGYDNFFALRQAKGRIYVQRPKEQETSKRNVTRIHSGRIVSFQSLPYHKALQAQFSKTMTTAHDFTFATLRKGRKDQSKSLVDKKGLVVPISAKTTFWVNISFADEWVIQLSKRAYATQKEADQQLQELSLPYLADPEPSSSFWRFIVIASGGDLKNLMEVFRTDSLHVGLVRRQSTILSRWANMAIEDDQLVLSPDAGGNFPARYHIVGHGEQAKVTALDASKDGKLRLPAAALLYVTSASPFRVPDDALVLISGVKPSDKWPYLLLHLLLIGFILLNAVAIRRRMRLRHD